MSYIAFSHLFSLSTAKRQRNWPDINKQTAKGAEGPLTRIQTGMVSDMYIILQSDLLAKKTRIRQEYNLD